MRSDVITVTNNTEDIGQALTMIERTTVYCGFDEKYSMKIRLLGEELIQSASHILEEINGTLWIDTEAKTMRLHLKLDGMLSTAARKKLIEVSKSGKNTPPKGLFAKISSYLDEVFCAGGGYVATSAIDGLSDNQMITLSLMDDYYMQSIEQTDVRESNDELQGIEQTILSAVADDISVSVRTNYAEIVVVKRLP